MILVTEWLYCDIIFSLLIIFGEGVIISWHHIFTPDDIGDRVIILWHYIFIPDNIWWGGDYIVTLCFHSWQYLVRVDYIVTLYFHSWQYLVRGWLYHDTVFSLLIIFGEGWLYRDIIFSLLAIFDEGVIISWHYIFIPGNIWWGDDCIMICWSTFGILVWNDSGYVNLTQWWYFFIIFEYILHISTPHIMIFCFPLPYFPLSTSALFFA